MTKSGVDPRLTARNHHYGEHAGKLHGMWQKDHYVFTETPTPQGFSHVHGP
jgi:hypothetical protein